MPALPLTRPLGALAALALGAGLVVAGAVGAAQAAPGTPTITSPTDASVTVADTVTVSTTVGDWGGSDGGGYVRVTVANAAGGWTCDSPTLDYTAPDWSCDVTLAVGDNVITAVAYGDSTGEPGPTSASVTVTRGGLQDVVIGSPPADSGISSEPWTISGTGPSLGDVTVVGEDVRSPGSVELCSASVALDGTWSCGATFPGHADFSVWATGVAIDGSTAVTPADPQALTFRGAKPGASVTSTSDLLSATVTADAGYGEEAGVRWRQFLLDGTGGLSQTCPTDWNINDADDDPGAGAVVTCDIATPPAGLYLLSGNAWDNGTLSSDRGDLVLVPEAPLITTSGSSAPGTAFFSGTADSRHPALFGTVLDAHQVTVTGAGGYEVCTATVDPDTDAWACSGPAPLDETQFIAVTRTVGFADDPAVVGIGADGYHDGVSAESAPAAVTVLTPPFAITDPADGSAVTWDWSVYLDVQGTTPDIGTAVELYLGDDLVAGCDDITPEVTGHWSCGFWAAADPGPQTLTAWQDTESTASTFDIVIPAPQVESDPLEVEIGDGSAWFWGYGLENHTVEVEVGEESCTGEPMYIDEGGWGYWECQVDITGFALGDHEVTSHQRPVPDDDPGVLSETTTSTLTILPDAPIPTIECVFTPAGVTATRTDPGVFSLRYYPVIPGDESETGEPGTCNGAFGTPVEQVGDWGSSIDCDPTCTLTGLAPGLHNLYYGADDDCGECGEFYDYYFTVPATPAITSVASTTTSVLLSGTGTAGDRIRAYSGSGSTLCSATVGSTGRWSCVFPRSSAATARVVDIDASSGGMSAYSASRSIPTTLVIPVAAPPTEQQTRALVQWLLEFGEGLDALAPGSTITISSDGLPAGTRITVWLNSTPRLLGTAVATGAPMTLTFTVPQGVEPGSHTLVLNASTPDGEALSQQTPVTVGSSPVAPTDDGDGGTDGDDGGADGEDGTPGGGTGGGARNEPAAPNVLSDALPTVSRIMQEPALLFVGGGLAVALLFFVALPTELLNSTLAANHGRLGRGFAAVERGTQRVRDWFLAVTRSRALAAALLLLVVSFIFGFSDPAFGPDLASVRLVLALAIALFILSYGIGWLTGLIVKRVWGVSSAVEIEPAIAVFAIIGVVFARLLGFSPGFLLGVVIGLELFRPTKRANLGASLLQFGLIVAASLLAWLGYGALSGTPLDDFGSALLAETLAAITIEGLTAAAVAILPLRFLEGRDLWEQSKALWLGAFLVIQTAFALLVLPTAFEGTEVGDFAVWIAVFGAFAVLTLAVWFVFARADTKATEREKEDVDA